VSKTSLEGKSGKSGILTRLSVGDRAAGGTADWAEVNPALLARLIVAVTSRGGAVRFGYTRDGGAYSIGLYYGAENNTQYVRPGQDLEGEIERYVQTYEDIPSSGGVSPDYGKRG
jgi:hypothetical protein